MRNVQEREQDRQREQTRLDALRKLAERNRSGQFATPPTLALEIAEYVRQFWNQREQIRFLEPCVGSGSFYSALLQVFPANQLERATGFDIDADHVQVARALWQQTGLRVTTADFTQQPPPRSRYNLLLTNPPYVRHHHVPKEEKERLQQLVRDRVGIALNGLAGLYCYMMLLADAWLEPGGLSCWLVPAEFLDVNYGRAIKEYLTRRVKLLRIHRYCPSGTLFADALVSSAVVVFEKAEPAPDHTVRLTFGGSLQQPQQETQIPVAALDPAAKWGQFSAPPTATKTGATLGDLFTIKRGLATGDNDFFILSRVEARLLGIPDQFVRPILPPPRLLKENIIDADADGYPQRPSQLALIDCPLPENQLADQFPRFWTYLERGKKRGVHTCYLASRRTPWYSQEKRPPTPFLCTYMGRASNGRKPFRFLWNKSQATAHNVYLLLYPRPELQAALAATPDLHAEVFALLQTIDTNGFIGAGRVYGGGLYKMEPRELGAIPAEPILELIQGQPFRLF